MQRKYLAFDIETAKQWPEGADWRPYRPLGIACAATFPADSEAARLWYGSSDEARPGERMSRRDAAELVEHLHSMSRKGYVILSWNGLGFDFDVLAEESGMAEECSSLALGQVDMMFHVFCRFGYPVGLAAAAEAMKLSGKPEGMSGLLAPRMWAEGKRQEVLDYVAQDARTTLELARKCEEEKCFRWITRKGTTKQMSLGAGWLTASAALELPQPDTSWMSRPLSRDKFTAWLRT